MITGVILAHNEEHNIVECVTALRPHVGEVLLIDTESSDRTVELATPLVDRVLSHPNAPNFDALRNLAIPEARFDWFWFVDADERIPHRTGQLVNELLRTRGHEFEAINIPFKSFFCGQWMQHCGWWPGYTGCRVVKRGHFEYGHDLHSGISLRGREIRFPADPELAVPHYSYRDIAHYVSKCNGYTSTEATQLDKQNVTYNWRLAIQRMMQDLWAYYERHGGRRDGSLGWILSWLSGQYRWTAFTKLIDLQRGMSTESAPNDLDEVIAAMEHDLAACRRSMPELPLGIILQLDDPSASGADEEFTRWSTTLADSIREVAIATGNVKALLDAHPDQARILKLMCRARRPRSSIGIVFDGALTAQPSEANSFNVLRTRWPCDAELIADECVDCAKRFDEVWTATADEQLALRRRGVAAERLQVLPSGFDSDSDDLQARIAAIETRLAPPIIPAATASQIRVEWEGELFAAHSFSNVNESVLRELHKESSLAVRLRRLFYNPTNDSLAPRYQDLIGFTERDFPGAPQVTVRHAYPPNWVAPEEGVWVHIQPWEFGYLPNSWIEPLASQVDEIWAPSKYVKRVYVDSGIAPEKIHVIPWGIDPEVFSPMAPPLLLPSQKSFRFLYVGGTIHRKGFDRLFDAYLAEFTPDDDVSLVVKDVGTRTFYAPSNWRAKILDRMNDPDAPEIIYMDDDFTPSQLASLYTACDCFVAPYRGEGFGLPVLEALACGRPPIVPSGGPTDDFVGEESGYFLSSQQVHNEMAGLCKPGTELHVSPDELRRTMRRATADQERTRALGRRGAEIVRSRFTWTQSARLMSERIHALADRGRPDSTRRAEKPKEHLTAAVLSTGDERVLPECLCRNLAVVGGICLVDPQPTDRTKKIAIEYGAQVVPTAHDALHLEDSGEWVLVVHSNESVDEVQAVELQKLLVTLPPQIDAVRVVVRNQLVTQPDIRETRIHRRSNSKALRESQLGEIDDLLGQDGPNVFSSDIVIDVFARVQVPPATRSDLAQKMSNEPRSTDRSRGILLQLATGPHDELLALTQAHHRSYAARHGLEYLCVHNNLAAPKRPGWAKISLVLATMRMGFDRIVWLDADAVIVDSRIDLSTLVPDGIGMVRHPNSGSSSTHWNSGVMIVTSSPATQRFFETVDAAPENDSPWMEQLAINAIAEQPVFSELLLRLAPAFNSTPGAAMADSPVILAAHGLPHEERRCLLSEWLTHANGQQRIADDATVVLAKPEDFGDFLNQRGHVGEGVEIGSLHGDLAKALLDRWNGRTLHLVGPSSLVKGSEDMGNLADVGRDLCIRELEEQLSSHVGRYRLHRKMPDMAVGSFADESLDFASIDADYELLAMLRQWFPKLRPKGILAGRGSPGAASAVDTFSREMGLVAHAAREPAWPSWYIIKP